MNEKLLAISTICFSLTTCIWCYVAYDKGEQILKLKEEKLELLQSLNKEKIEVIKAKQDLIEAHEILGNIFMEAMADRQIFNEFKKSKCKGKK